MHHNLNYRKNKKVSGLEKVNITQQKIKPVDNIYGNSKISFERKSSLNSQVSKSIVSSYKKTEYTPKSPIEFHSARHIFDEVSHQFL